ncbi:tetratricopeptide repeat protein [Alkaliflexus imshenetskii]|uniref:tetratricopeptide repeat protein n=1 Tax=Alkaliflexus imshenetskii TaxID=286730 RepID=UPI00047DFD1E|nr:tetratricopeptide repeat protein [Alkaliflexus imshenetskii]
MNYFKNALYSFFILVVVASCGSTKKASTSFEDVLYPTGRFFTIKHQDEFVQRRFEYLFLEGNRLKMMGDLGNSALYYTEALKLDSTCATCYFEIGNLLIQSRDFENAENYLFKAVQYDPTNEFFLSLLSKLYLHNDKIELALKSALYLADQYPTNPEYLYHLSQIQYGVGQYQASVNTLNRIESLVGINEMLSLEKHSVWVAANKPKLAEQELTKLINTYPANLVYRIYLGDFYTQTNQLPKAYQVYNDVRLRDPQNGQVHFSLANYYLNQRDSANFKSSLKTAFSSSNVDIESKIQRIIPFLMSIDSKENPLGYSDFIVYFDAMVKAHPHESQTHILYANFYRHFSKDSLAATHFESALLIDENQEDVWQEFLVLAFTNYELESMIKHTTRAATLFPENGFFYYTAGYAYLLNKRNEDAVGYLLKAVELSDSNTSLKSQIYGMLGDIYFQLSKPEQSFESYRKSLEINPDNIVVLNNYAYYLSVVGKDLDRAEQMISKVIELEPNNSTYLDTYAWVLFKKARYVEALFIIEQAMEHGGASSGVILEHYGDILFKNGNVDKAMVYWKLASETDDEVSSVLAEKIRTSSFIPEN